MKRKGRVVRKSLNNLNFEKLDNKILLSANPWYIDAIKAPALWNMQSLSDNKPIVAIVDSGVDLNHPDIIPNLFHNKLDPIDGIDNDKNGYVDDYTGWNFVNYGNVPQDGYYHGTHIAGIVNAIGHGEVSILPIKSIGDSGSGYSGSVAAGINYAVTLKNEGYNVVAINCSFGGFLNNSLSIDNAIKNASDNGIVVVIAAGNDGGNLDITPRYPGSLSYTNTITVAGTNSDNSLAGYSNYGKISVLVGAPGSSIYSTLPGGTYGYVSGTSMSAGVVSGTVGLLNKFGHYGANVIKNAIAYGCDTINVLVDKVKYGLINLQNSITWLKNQPQGVSAPPVNSAPATPVVPAPAIVSLVYKITSISKTNIQGWAKLQNSNRKPVVEIYINKALRYSVSATQYRLDTKSNNGFNITIQQKFLKSGSNLVEVKIKDSMYRLVTIAYTGYINK